MEHCKMNSVHLTMLLNHLPNRLSTLATFDVNWEDLLQLFDQLLVVSIFLLIFLSQEGLLYFGSPPSHSGKNNSKVSLLQFIGVNLG